ncbi:uncharacterized protein LOC132799241 isoform X3 [Ziziphus jujuba]|uniref:Uncharacterized protein LOC107426503 isoform X3 n=1 Tax=Ziziphus jujuba TaxID=326968 RepID=A0ABM4ADV2_ZIZJJ|nr:uncharacterized protein LOC107426503 isoform X3 [Ziziphus jujuba]XP_060674911.1 uncharacterized protein LOC132799241 isoform X3 [Ziziphus jujuba]
MGGGQVCPVDHFIPNEGDKSDPSGDWVTFVPPSSLRSISGRPLRSIVDLASPSPSKHLAGGRSLILEANYPSKHFWPQYSSKDYAEVGVLTILSSSIVPYLMPVVIPFREFEQQRELRERGLQTTCDESAGRKLFSDDTINAQMDKDLERRAATAEAALKRARLNYSIAVDQLQKDLELLSSQVLSMYETNENLIKQAFSECSLPSFPEYEEMAQNQKLDSKESHAARLLQCQNQFHEEKKQNLDADIFLEDLKRSLFLQKGLYQKVEEEVYEVHLLNVYLDVFSKTLQETLLDASADFRLMKDKINKLTQQLELSTESKELLMLKLQDATMRFTISRNTKMPVIQNATAWLCIIKL